MTKVTLATVWLDGCSGCHMSLLDLDERLLQLADQVELVYSPLVDRKDFPGQVDVTLVEGAVSSEDDLKKIRHVRAHTRVLVTLGDCAVTGNVPSLRNAVGGEAVLQCAYLDPGLLVQQIPTTGVPRLLPTVRPVHAVVPVDVFVPGCPPSPTAIFDVLCELLAGRIPDLRGRTRFGA